MTQVLVIDSSALGAHSASRQLTDTLIDRWRAADPSLSVVRRDVGAEPLPHLTGETLAGLDPAAPAEMRALGDALIAEVKAADVLVIGAPMYNFGIPSTLKAWFDHILRAGETFRYTAAGPEGLLTGKRAIVVSTRGGLYSEGPAAVMDAQEPHLRALLSFVGITDVTFVRAEGLKVSPEQREQSIAAALAHVETLGGQPVALAA